jgi:predicted DNA-binding transcriptional regulator YafY
MYSPTTRLLTLLELLQSRTSVSGIELSEMLEVDVRSIRRYVTMLRDLGIPVESEKGRYGSYSLRPGFRLPPLMFTDMEILSVILGLMAVKRLGMATTGGSESATAKILRVLPDELRERVSAFQGVLSLDIPMTVREEVLSRFSMSAYQRRQLWIEYLGGGRGSMTERAVDVYGLVYRTGYWYAVGFCHLREDIRIFRLDRVRHTRVLDEPFIVPSQFDALQYLIDSIATIPSVFMVEVLFKTTLAEAQSRIPTNVGSLEETPDGILLRAWADGLDWMARFLVYTGFKFTVVSPPTLRDKLREVARAVTRMAKEEPDAPTHADD